MTTKYHYPYIRAWGNKMGSQSYFIEDQVRLARHENAPADAMWRGVNGKWHLFSEMLNHNPNKILIANYVKGLEDENA